MQALNLQPRELSDLAHRTQTLALRYDRTRREAGRIGIPDDCKETSRRVEEIDQDAETIAELERLVASVRRHGLGVDNRPATVLRLVPSTDPVSPASAPRLGLWARTKLALGRAVHQPSSEVA